MIDDPTDIPGQGDYIVDEEYYRGIGYGSRRKHDESLGYLDLSDYGTGILEEQGWIPEQYEKDIFGRMQQPDPDNPGFDIKGNPLVETEFWDDKYLDYQAGETVPFHDYYEYIVKTGEITPTLGWSTGGQTLLPGATPNVGAHPFVSDWDYELHPDQIAMMRPEAWETWSDEERETWERDLIDEQLLLDMTPEESFHWQGDIDEAYWDSWRTSVAGNPLMHGQAVPNAYDPGMTGNIYGRDRQHLLGTPEWDEDAQEWIRQDDPWYKFWK